MFNKRPINPVRSITLNADIGKGYNSVCSAVLQRMRQSGKSRFTVAVDGTHGVPFADFQLELIHYFQVLQVRVEVVCTEQYLQLGERIREIFKRNITDNRAFGYVTKSDIGAYFVPDAFTQLQAQLKNMDCGGSDDIPSLYIVIGTGAHWIGQGDYDLSLFLDLSRENQQIKHKRGLLNFGLDQNEDALEKYKIAYFVEWPILEAYRKRHFHEYDYYVDMNDEHMPFIVPTRDLTEMIRDISRYPFRVKPFFAPGIWGGQYLKKMAELPEDMINCAWSFEPIAPENSILIGQDETVIEIPFLIVMAISHQQIMGDRVVGLFGDYFPIRFDYLDTIDGGNLSCQVHPKQEYIRRTFNEFMEQQESYYIMEKKGDSKVYLGLTASCAEEALLGAVNQAQRTGVPMEFTQYVQEWDSEKGDLFLIPTGTVHCAGKDNMVLEISATTWWFTFKIYDYVRNDMDGKPRPMNIDYAKDNIDYYKKTEWVRENLIAKPKFIQRQGNNEEYELGHRDDLLFYVNRIHLQDQFVDTADGEFVMLNLVEGEKVKIVSTRDSSHFVEMSYAESYIIPAAFGSYTILNAGLTPCKIIKAGVSPEWEVNLTDE